MDNPLTPDERLQVSLDFFGLDIKQSVSGSGSVGSELVGLGFVSLEFVGSDFVGLGFVGLRFVDLGIVVLGFVGLWIWDLCVCGFGVLLIEAGDEEPEVIDIPSYALMTQQSSIDWNFRTQPQEKSCLRRPDKRCNWPRGKVVGGSSSMNLMIYLRGGPKDYNEWERLGNRGWSYEKVLPYFKKSEHNNNFDKVDPNYHGKDGEMSIEFFPYQDQNVYAILQSYRELGLDVFDQNTERQVGASLMQHYARDGERVTANSAFLRPIRGQRKNLYVLTNAFVTKVLVNPQSKTAYGVEFHRDGKFVKVYARKEVILSAGTIGSPKILMLSGIGPLDELHKFDIKVIQGLSVGTNLHDHVSADGPIIALTNRSSTLATSQQRTLDIHRFKLLRRGPLSSTSTIQVNSFIQTSFEKDEDRPDVQFSIEPTVVQDYYTDPALTARANVRPLAYYDGFMIRPVLLAPRSRGYILLNSTDPVFGDPLIYPNTFFEDEDLQILIEATQKISNLVDMAPLRSLGARLITLPVPGCETFQFGSNEYWRCVMTLYTSTLYHPVGTCKMGSKYDKDAVIDPLTLGVHGVKRLRVIDASVMPIVTRANTNAATVMIAERGADFIKRDWISGYAGNSEGVEEEKTDYADFDAFFGDLFG
ncbi:hypothetical protein NQ318_012063 [Aromia moschata]|uniref:Glucose-methanol-choline oxidoreductase N-terminal domain-containing protein n=1 Tax=Aromia moschata TaxID=1265417 RepID=A0AAV8Y4E5_9CUCU|nr:hypothetical protein NQ318_012063 [Aromia moschata]